MRGGDNKFHLIFILVPKSSNYSFFFTCSKSLPLSNILSATAAGLPGQISASRLARHQSPTSPSPHSFLAGQKNHQEPSRATKHEKIQRKLLSPGCAHPVAKSCTILKEFLRRRWLLSYSAHSAPFSGDQRG